VILQTLPQDPFNPRGDKGPSTFDVTHVFTLSLIQSLPLDRVRFLLSHWGKTLTKGWQFLDITTLTTGPPFTVYSGVQQTGAGAGGTDRPESTRHAEFFHQPHRARGLLRYGRSERFILPNPHQRPRRDRSKTMGVSGLSAAAHFAAPASTILTWP